MTDFYTVLRNALDRVGAGDDTRSRDRVYAHVRDVMIGRLQNHRPPLSQADIDARLDDFDYAVARIEEEVAESVFAEPELAYAGTADEQPGDWGSSAGADEGPAADVPAEPEPAAPESFWGSTAIDLAWNESTAQWQDPSEVMPPSRATHPVGEWEERLNVALHDDRTSPRPVMRDEDFFEEGEWDHGAEPADEARPRRSRLGAIGGLLRKRPPARGARPVEDALPKVSRRAARKARAEERGTYAPVPDGGAGIADAERAEPTIETPLRAPGADLAILYLESPPGSIDTGAELQPLPRSAKGQRVDRYANPDLQQAHTETRPEIAALASGAAGPAIPRGSAGRTLTIAVSVLAGIVAIWCAYVFVPLLFPGDGEDVTDPTIAVAAQTTLESITLFGGEDPMVFQGGPDNPVRFEAGDTGGYVTLASATSNGFRAVIGRGIADRVGGHQIRVALTLRGTPGRPADTLRVGYLRGEMLLDWRTFTVTEDFTLVTEEWTIPPSNGNAADHLVIQPSIPGDGLAVDIAELRIQILP